MCSCFLFSTLLHSLCSLLFTLCEFCPLLNISHATFVEVLSIFVQLYRLLFFIYSLLYVIVYLYSPYCLLILGMCVYLISNNDFTYFHSIRSLVCLFLFNIDTLSTWIFSLFLLSTIYTPHTACFFNLLLFFLNSLHPPFWNTWSF